MTTSIELMLDALDWRKVDKPADLNPGDLYATHEGTLMIGPLALRCYVLNDGRRLVDSRDVDWLMEYLGSE